MTDHLQPMDISVMKPAKTFLKRKFEDWYVNLVHEQLQGEDVEIDAVELQPVDLSMPVMATYIADNPQFIVNGFIRSRIPGALDGKDISAVTVRATKNPARRRTLMLIPPSGA